MDGRIAASVGSKRGARAARAPANRGSGCCPEAASTKTRPRKAQERPPGATAKDKKERRLTVEYVLTLINHYVITFDTEKLAYVNTF